MLQENTNMISTMVLSVLFCCLDLKFTLISINVSKVKQIKMKCSVTCNFKCVFAALLSAPNSFHVVFCVPECHFCV